MSVDPVRDVLLGLSAAAADPISGGRHKVFGHPALHILPQTSTIASHLPRAVGLAFALGNLADLAPRRAVARRRRRGDQPRRRLGQPLDGQGALNAAAYLTHRGLDVPLLVVVEDNGSASAPAPRPAGSRRRCGGCRGIEYVEADRRDPDRCSPPSVPPSTTSGTGGGRCCCTCGPCASSATPAPTSSSATAASAEIARDHERDPLLATAAYLVETGT